MEKDKIEKFPKLPNLKNPGIGLYTIEEADRLTLPNNSKSARIPRAKREIQKNDEDE